MEKDETIVVPGAAEAEKLRKWLRFPDGRFRVAKPDLYLEIEFDEVMANFSKTDQPKSDSEALNSYSVRPLWAPVDFYRETDALKKKWEDPSALFAVPATVWLNAIRIKGALKGTKFARKILNLMQQAATNQANERQHYLEIYFVHLPMYNAVASHYNWLIKKKVAPNVLPEKLFPAHWLDEDEEDVELLNRQSEENSVAVLQNTNLFWCSPLIMAFARARASSQDWETEGLEMKTFFVRLNWLLRNLSSEEKNQYPLPYFNGNLGTNQLFVPSSIIMADMAKIDAQASTLITSHCQLLGNTDTKGPRSLWLGAGAFGNTLDETNKRFIMLVLSYLIEHCRVFFRPIIIMGSLYRDICHLFGVKSLQQLFRQEAQLMPQPPPYFASLPDDHWIWVPVAKPRRYLPDGKTLETKPQEESAVYLGVDRFDANDPDQPPAKRQRTEATAHCLTCHQRVASDHAVPVMAFCTAACVHRYYDDM